MVFHIAVCSPDAALRSGLERQCMEYFARRQDACIVQQLPDADALLRRDTEGERFDLYLIELGAVAAPAGLSAAAELRRRGRRAPLAFAARTPAHAYSAFRVDAMQYLLLPVHQQELSALLARATEPEYGPAMTVATAEGLRALAYAQIEYLEVHPPCGALPSAQRRGCGVPFAAGVLCRGSKAAAGRRAFFAAAPLLCGQSGGGTAADSGRAADVQRCAHSHPARTGGCSARSLPQLDRPVKWQTKKSRFHGSFFVPGDQASGSVLCFFSLSEASRTPKPQWLAMSMMIFWGEPEG